MWRCAKVLHRSIGRRGGDRDPDMRNNAVSNWDAAVELAAERHMTSQQRHAHAQSVFGDEGAARTATSQELEWLLCRWQRRLRLLERDDRLQWNAGGMPRRRRGLV